VIEFSVGSYVVSWAVYLLFPAAVSIVTGVAEGFVNVKVLFPGLQHPSRTLGIAILLMLPIYLGLFACVQQAIGDIWFALVCASLIVFVGASASTAARSCELCSVVRVFPTGCSSHRRARKCEHLRGEDDDNHQTSRGAEFARKESSISVVCVLHFLLPCPEGARRSELYRQLL